MASGFGVTERLSLLQDERYFLIFLLELLRFFKKLKKIFLVMQLAGGISVPQPGIEPRPWQ